MDELKSLLSKLELVTIEDIQNITNSSMDEFIQIFTSSAKLHTKCSKMGINKITAILIKVWEHKSPQIRKRQFGAPKVKEESQVKEEPLTFNIPSIQMSEFALIQSRLGDEYRESIGAWRKECETQLKQEENQRTVDPSEGSSNHRGSELTQSTQQSNGKRQKSAKDYTKIAPAISRHDPRIKPLVIASLFADKSTLLNACFAAKFSENDMENFVEKALSNRCRTSKTRNNVLRFVLDYYDFAITRVPPAPLTGPSAVITISCWLEFIAGRGPSVPAMGRYALVVFSEALGVDLPLNHPAVVKGTKIPKPSAKHAPPLTVEFLVALETQAINRENPEGLRVYCSLFLLLTLASLRFADTADVSELRVTETAVCGVSVNHKDKCGRENSWATPKSGFHSDGGWTRPLMRNWDKLKPKKGKYTYLFPHVNQEWELNYKKRGTFGVVKTAISRIEKMLGFEKNAQLRSARNFFTTCAGQLLYGREFREKLGRWTPGSIMPDRYDRAECATELRLRSEIIAKIQGGWKPTKAFEVPPAEQHIEPKVENADDGSVSETEETSETSLPENIARLDEFV